MDFKQMIEKASDLIAMNTNRNYYNKFMDSQVQMARNEWHKAACEIDALRRMGCFEDSTVFRKAKEQEEKAHLEYKQAKENLGILETGVQQVVPA